MDKSLIIKPLRLNIGDTVGIVAPASSFDVDNFIKGVRKLRQLGFKVNYQRSIFNKCWSQPGHNKQRAVQINRMFSDKSIKAIFCAKAGYGSVEILPFLDKKIIRSNPKIFVGYSDITILLLYLQRVANMVVFHGPVVAGEIYQGMDEVTLDYLLKVLTRAEPLGVLEFGQMGSFKKGKSSGILTGGNLSLSAESLGTGFSLSTDAAVLFLEEVDENLDRIKECLLRLRRAGKFSNLKGIILGRMVDCFQARERFKALIIEIFQNYNIPIIFGFPSGHKNRKEQPNITLPLGVNVCLDADSPALEFTEPAVS
jgi:muramoyltetrapeptide carboxypeptidase